MHPNRPPSRVGGGALIALIAIVVVFLFLGVIGLAVSGPANSKVRERDRADRSVEEPDDESDAPKTTRRPGTTRAKEPERRATSINEPRPPPEVREPMPETPTPESPSIPDEAPPTSPGVVLVESFDKYKVTGDSIAAIRADVNVQRNGSHDAYTSWYVNWTYPRDTNGGCTTGTVTVTVTVNIRIPEHRPSSTTPASVTDAWNAYARALLAHENGHRDFGLRSAAEVKRELETLRERDCSLLDSVATTKGKAIVARHAAAERVYDQSTSHGATQGARFPCQKRGAGCVP